MPVNYQQALQQIREMGKQLPQQVERQRQLHVLAEDVFHQIAYELDTLEQLVEVAAATNPRLRCARPFREALDWRVPAPTLEEAYSLLAADGSQINPDRHGMVEFGAINVGVIQMKPGQGQPLTEQVRSRLMFHDDLYTASGSPLTDDLVALMRDLAERQELVSLARGEKGPVVTLTDGPLELFRDAKGSREFEKELEKYQDVLEDLASLDVATAGYVDRPRSDLVIRLLELVILKRGGRFDQAGIERPLLHIRDEILFRNLLKPGERSAVFAIHAGAGKGFSGRLALHFFYLNVGRETHPYLSRVEIPLWVAENEHLLNLLHGCLVAQSQHLGARPYPYVLHRAHEIAVVSRDEHDQLETMIAAELRKQGVFVDDRSNKQLAKDSSNNHTRSR